MSKVLYLSNSIIPSQTANSVHVMKMCSAFRSEVHDVTLLCKTKNKRDLTNDIFSEYQTENEFEIKSYTIGDGFFSRFRSLVVSFLFFPFYILRNARNSDIIYSRNRHASFILCLLRIKHDYEMHGISKFGVQAFIDKKIYHSKYTKSIIVISKSLKLDLELEFGLIGDKIKIAHDGADEIEINSVKKIDLKGSIHAGYVGSLLEGKGVDMICHVAPYFPNVTFHIVGGSSEEINELKKKHGHQNLIFYGYVNQIKVKSFLKAFDFVMLPNKSSVITSNGEDIGKYTSPLKLFEYLAFNKVIIASRISSFLEVVSDDDVYFFQESNLNDFKKAIENVLLGEKKLNDGKGLIKTKYSWDMRVSYLLGKDV
ncbi:glycosyltransferase family 4 protein [Vibrio cyclitrophicus]|uniref:glycosyltransferase family 4 protein n=1 Tax=Vibrio cyclitrophicus TaxID=47951 RepID=UPI00080E4C3B|nr:glycosyltransferase family 4 protein [Vibrio cyclitrophicus]OCH40308.1 hypothetical protein A6E07_10980 [Vibrio cyclitrophicus]